LGAVLAPKKIRPSEPRSTIEAGFDALQRNDVEQASMTCTTTIMPRRITNSRQVRPLAAELSERTCCALQQLGTDLWVAA
jgi:hypothetical protein